ncbi:diaminopimelate decarboxylase [Babesia caballi]|uniref:Diaminopimelate decarboxylase n=1 Tax=Babesia caballi TaxID=5871 RepID=A0AAV4M135_BABCB|nr:diaminopimelate decarboxylase [Babesia caballi]
MTVFAICAAASKAASEPSSRGHVPCVKAGVDTAQAPVQRIRHQLKRQLPHTQLRLPHLVALRRDCGFHRGTQLHQAPEDLREHPGHVGHHLDALVFLEHHRGETDVELLDDGGVQRVEVQQQYEVVVQPGDGLQHQPALVGLLLLVTLLLLVHGADCVFVEPLEVVVDDVLRLVEFVEEQKVVALRTRALHAAAPQVACDVGEFLGQRQRLQLDEQVERVERAVGVGVHQHEQLLHGVRAEALGDFLHVEGILAVQDIVFQCGRIYKVCDAADEVVVAPIVVQFLGQQARVAKDPSGVEGVTVLFRCPHPREGDAQRYVEHVATLQQYLGYVLRQVVPNHDVGVDELEVFHEVGQQPSLLLEDAEVRSLFQKRHNLTGPRLLVHLPDTDVEVLRIQLFYICGVNLEILVKHHCDLQHLLVRRRQEHSLDRHSRDAELRRREHIAFPFVPQFNLFVGRHLQFELARGQSVRRRLRVYESQPRGALDFALDLQGV